MRIDVYQQHGKDHDRNRGDMNRTGCGCEEDVGRTVTIDLPCLPPIGSGIWIQGSNGAWKEVTVERYTFRDPRNADRILCTVSYDLVEE
jgi:hypothetical protein